MLFPLLFLVPCLGAVFTIEPCPAPDPCSCKDDIIDCAGKNLIRVPTFTKSAYVYAKLNLSNNALTEIPQNAFINIQVVSIWIKDNPMLFSVHQSAFSRLPHLRDLHLDRNNIRILEAGSFTNLPAVEHIYLTQNQLTVVKSGTFVNLPKLEFLFLDYNNINTVENGTFVKTDHLGFLNLAFNSLVKLDYDVICHIRGLTTLNLMQNKLLCDCPMSWVEQWRTVKVMTEAGTRQIYGSCKRRDINAKSALYVHVFLCHDIVGCHSSGDILG